MSFQGLLQHYLPEIEKDIYYSPERPMGEGRMGSLLMYLTRLAYIRPLKIDIDTIRDAMSVLLEAGVDPTRKENIGHNSGVMISPLEIATSYHEAKDDPYKIYDLLLTGAIDQQEGALEGVAFEENRIIDKLKKVLPKIGSSLMHPMQTTEKAGNWLAKRLSDSAAAPAKNMGGIIGADKKLREAQNRQKEELTPEEKNNINTKAAEDLFCSDETGETRNLRFNEQSTPEKKRIFLLDNIFTKVKGEDNLSKLRQDSSGITVDRLRSQIIDYLLKVKDPFTCSSYKVAESFIENRYTTSEVSLLFRKEFNGLAEDLKRYVEGISKDEESRKKQIKIIAFFNMRGWGTNRLRTKTGKWRSSREMEKIVRSLDGNRVSNPKKKAPSPTTKKSNVPKEIMKEAITNLTSNSIKTTTEEKAIEFIIANYEKGDTAESLLSKFIKKG